MFIDLKDDVQTKCHPMMENHQLQVLDSKLALGPEPLDVQDLPNLDCLNRLLVQRLEQR